MIKLFTRKHIASHSNWFLFFLSLTIPDLSQAQYAGQHRNEIAVQEKAPVKAYSFDLQDVKLLPGRFKDNSEREAAWMLEHLTGYTGENCIK